MNERRSSGEVDSEVAGSTPDSASNAAAEETIVDAEVVPDEVDDSSPGTEAAEAEAVGADLDELLVETTRERDEYLELARRARADFDNYRRRVASETSAAEQRGRAALAGNLLPALDNLERALIAAGVDPAESPDPGGEPPSEEVSARDALARGVALVYRELGNALQRAGVVSFDPVGEQFDPSLHEAISTGEAEGIGAGMVLETLERGYRVDSQVIRPARVVVSG